MRCECPYGYPLEGRRFELSSTTGAGLTPSDTNLPNLTAALGDSM
jgi:hypothetical protein